MSFIKEENIGKISFIGTAILVVVLTTILGSIFISAKYNDFQENLQRVKRNYIALQKERLSSDVKIQISRFKVRLENIEQNLNISLKNRVDRIYSIIQNLYKENKTPEEVQSLVRNILHPARFDNSKGSISIRSVNGSSILYSPDPLGEEGINTKLNHDQAENEIFQRMLTIVQGDKEGFLKSESLKPGDRQNKFLKKNIYVKYFEPLNWIISSSEYLYNVEEDLRQSLLKYLNNTIPDLNSPEYIFIYHLHDINGGEEFASMLVNPNRPDLIGKKIPDSYMDAKGKMFRKEMLQGLRDKGEAYVTYWYKKPGSDAVFAKLSYFKYYPEWHWIVAKGTYYDHLDRRVGEMQANLRQEIKGTIRLLVYFTIITCIIFLAFSFLFSKNVHTIFERYKKMQQEHQGELEKVNKALKVLATTDPLTKLYNRGYLNTHLGNEISRANRYGSSLSLIIIDIDRFKRINDTLGHLSGDNILIELSQLIQVNIRNSDILSRWGGEEFVVLAPGTSNRETTFLAEKLRECIENHQFSIGSQMTCSFGVTQYIAKEQEDAFIHRADKALYKAKEEGRNRVISS